MMTTVSASTSPTSQSELDHPYSKDQYMMKIFFLIMLIVRKNLGCKCCALLFIECHLRHQYSVILQLCR